jgi:putative addiction module component (TIGR02574 family)
MPLRFGEADGSLDDWLRGGGGARRASTTARARRWEPRYTERVMSAAAKEIIEAALKLDPAERAHVAHELLESIAGDANGGLDAEWIKELEQRARDIEEGRTDFVSWPEARQEIENSLRRGR